MLFESKHQLNGGEEGGFCKLLNFLGKPKRLLQTEGVSHNEGFSREEENSAYNFSHVNSSHVMPGRQATKVIFGIQF